MKLSREELLEIIESQSPEFIKSVNRIEWVFANKLSELTEPDGSHITERPFTKEELIRLIDPPFVFSRELMKQGFNEDMQRQLHIASDPVLWCKQILGAKPRAYQVLVMRDDHHQIVLRWGRRLGKSMALSMYILWYAFVHTRARILVLAPAKTQVGLLYEAILELAEASPIVSEAITKKPKHPQHEIWLSNGASIKLFTTGLRNGSKSDGARGQEADMLVLDEMDYMGTDDLVAVMAMLQKTDETKKFQKKIIGASTPTGQRKTFWKWNTDPKEDYHPYFFPSLVNPMWTSEEEQKAKRRYRNEQQYRHEILADWGEDADGVYGRSYVDTAFNILPEWHYETYEPNNQRYIYTMGVDWDKHGAGVNIVIAEAPALKPSNGPVKIVYREEVRKGDFTYLESIERIIQLDRIFNFKHIYVDQGAGEVQQELLHRYGMENPSTRLHIKTKACHFSNTIDIRDPYTRQKEKKRLKPFMVDNLVHFLETRRVIFNPSDDELYLQLISYIKIRENDSGYPVFAPGGDTVDHAHDALLLCLFAITENYDELFENFYFTPPVAISNSFFMPNKDGDNKPVKLPDEIEEPKPFLKVAPEDSILLSPQKASVRRKVRRVPVGNIKRKMF